MHYLLAVLAMFLFTTAPAKAGETLKDVGVIVCVNDKWDEKEVEKGHKLVDAVQRCVLIPTEEGPLEKVVEDCVGKYEYMPDESWKGSGTCTDNRKDGKLTNSWEEGSHLKEYTYKVTGGTGKYEGATGEGTYVYDNLSDTIAGGTYKGTVILR